MERQRLQYLLNQYTNRKATLAEVQELNQLDLSSEENRAMLSELLAEGFGAHREPGYDTTSFDNLDQRALAIDKYTGQDIADKPSTSVTHGVHFLQKWGWAAAVLVILGAAAYVWLRPNQKDEVVFTKPAPVKNDVAPGGEKAVLTLGDGSVIILDSAANGLLAMQGNARISKEANGKITYNLTGQDKKDAMVNTMTTPKGGQYQLVLPDGSKVWLNAASSITFPAVFAGKERKVKVNGELYFEVVKDKLRPFIVDVAGKQSVEVLGTSFNINSYEDESVISTTLLEGSVKVSTANASAVAESNRQLPRQADGLKGDRSATILTPGQQARLAIHHKQNEKPDFEITLKPSVDVSQVTAWKNDVFNFTGMDLPAVMRQLARWYDLEVKYEGTPPVKEFRGKMSRNLQLSEVLVLLNGLNLQFTIQGKTLIVKGS